MTPPAPIRIDGLVHDYGQGPVLRIEALEIGPGLIHLKGPNGAGKTTLLRILATLLTPTQGQLRLDGLDPRTDGPALRARIGYAGHQLSLHPPLPLGRALALHARLHGLPPTRARQAAERWGLADVLDRPVAHLSQGQARRADLARATLHAPGLLLLDEPTAGLDTEAIAQLGEHLLDGPSTTIVLASHQAPPVEPAATLTLQAGRPQEAPA